MKHKFLAMAWLCLLLNTGWTQSQINETANQSTDQTATEDAKSLSELSQPAADSTHVKVIIQKNQTIEEYRQRGELVLVKVIPNEGKPYFIDPLEADNMKGSGKDLLNSGVKPVRWVLKEF